MRELLIFARCFFVSYFFLFTGAVNIYCQDFQNSSKRPFHKGSNKEITRTITLGTQFQKRSPLNTQLLKENEFSTLNISPFNSNTSRTFSVSGAISVAVTVTGSTCGYNNGSIIAFAIGGTSPYTYDIGDGWKYKAGNFPHLISGPYTLIVTDATGQSTSVNVTVGNTYPKVTLAPLSYKKVSRCDVADASVVLQASGGVPPYEYSMDGVNYQSSNAFSGFYPGIYDFYVRDANGCIGSFNSWYFGAFMNFSCDGVGTGYTPFVCGSEGNVNISRLGPNAPFTYSMDGIHYQSSGSFSNLTSGMYTFYLKDATGNVQVMVVPLHQSCYIGIEYISVDAACGQNDGTLTVTASNGAAPYTYTIDGINYQSSNEFTGLAPGTYFITVKDADGFTNSLAATVYDRCPTVSVTVTDETCSKNDGTIKAIPNKGTSPYQYSIDGVNFQNSTDFTGLTAGSYTVTIRDANGFTSTTDAIIKNACVQVSAQTTNSKCGGSNGSIIVSASNGTAPYQYSVDGTNFQTSNSFNNLIAGIYTVTAKDLSGKTGNTIVKIYDTPKPTVTVNSSPASCSDNDGSMMVTGTGGTLPFSYSIDGTNFQSNNNFPNLKSGSYTAYIKDGNGCINSTAASIAINCPIVSVTVNDETCGSKNGMITANGSNGTPPYLYSIDGTTFSNSQNFLSLPSGSYVITIKDAIGMTNTTSVVIKNICPTVTAIVTDGKCTEKGGVITAQGNDGYAPYQYSIDGVNYQQSNIFSDLTSGKYTVGIKDNYGLINTTQVTVQNFPSPKIAVNVTSATCFNNDGQLNIAAVGGTAPFAYSIDGSVFQAADSFDKLKTGSYNVTIKDANGCMDIQTSTINLNDNFTLSVDKQVEICEGNSIRLNSVSNASNYNWSPNRDIDNISNQNPLISPRQTTTYFVMATLGICSKKDSVIVLVNVAPVARAQKDTTICYGQSVSLFGSGGSYYSWSPSVYLNNPSSATPVVSNPKVSTTYSLKVTDGKGCASLNTASVKITVTPPVKLFAGNDTSIVMNEPFQLLAQDINNGGFISYSWSPVDGLNKSSIQNPIAILDHNIVYTVTASTQAGCEGSDEIAIKVYKGPDIFVPNAFTPNNDGLNDLLKPTPVGIKEFKYFVIYNRYGERVFYSTNVTKGWNGAFKNQLQKSDVFVWLAEGKDDKGYLIKRQGTVVLIR